LGVRLTTSPRKKVENLRDAIERIDKQVAIWLQGKAFDFWYMEQLNTVQHWSTNIIAVTTKTV